MASPDRSPLQQDVLCILQADFFLAEEYGRHKTAARSVLSAAECFTYPAHPHIIPCTRQVALPVRLVCSVLLIPLPRSRMPPSPVLYIHCTPAYSSRPQDRSHPRPAGMLRTYALSRFRGCATVSCALHTLHTRVFVPSARQVHVPFPLVCSVLMPCRPSGMPHVSRALHTLHTRVFVRPQGRSHSRLAGIPHIRGLIFPVLLSFWQCSR